MRSGGRRSPVGLDFRAWARCRGRFDGRSEDRLCRLVAAAGGGSVATTGSAPGGLLYPPAGRKCCAPRKTPLALATRTPARSVVLSATFTLEGAGRDGWRSGAVASPSPS